MTKNRSLWKGPFVNKFFMESTLIRNENYVRTKSRSSYILPYLIGRKLEVYNGKDFVRVTITSSMVGLKLGELSLTRKEHVYKSKRKKKKIDGSKN